MFETVLGIPAHPLLLHAAIVFVPLLVAASVVYAVVPMIRTRIAWAVVLLALAGPLSALFAKLSGDAFRRRLIRRHLASPEILSKITTHMGFGNMTLYLAIALGVATLAMVGVVMARRSRSGTSWTALSLVLLVASVGLSVATGYYVFRTGDTGAHIVWQNY